ncbi:MAG: cardiolipin synthase ClsB [Georgfuchsia sp.]
MKPRFVEGNAVRLLENGAEYFPALVEAIDSATSEVHLESYIFANDDAARAVVDALIRARQRGSEIRVLVDGFGAPDFRDQLGADLIAADCEVMIYRAKVAKQRFRRNRLRRLHRKLVVIDGRIAFVGGLNIIADTTDTDPEFPRHDYALCVEGPLVADIHNAVRHLWRLVRWAYLGKRPEAPAAIKMDCKSCGLTRAAFLVRDNLRHRRDIEDAYLDAIEAARAEVLIACAYFLPGKRFRRALIEAAQRGVNIVLLLQSRGDHAILRNAERHLYRELLPAGICIIEYHSGFLHAKVGVVDQQWATVGSSNIDPFSLLLSREANVVIDDADFTATLRARLQSAINIGGRQVQIADMNNLSWWSQLVNRTAYAFVRFAVSVSHYGGKDYRE